MMARGCDSPDTVPGMDDASGMGDIAGLRLPPLFRAVATGGLDPLAVARHEAARGTDAGLIAHDIAPDRLRAALVLAPEEALESAVAALVACGVGFQNAMGELAPPETAVYLTWQGGIRLNGASCGRLRAIADTRDARRIPGWLVIGLDLWLALPAGVEPGRIPDRTSLAEEGCGDILPAQLLESWARHSLIWLNALQDGARDPLFQAWHGLVEGIGSTIAVDDRGTPRSGLFEGVEPDFAMRLKTGAGRVTIPLVSVLENEDET